MAIKNCLNNFTTLLFLLIALLFILLFVFNKKADNIINENNNIINILTTDLTITHDSLNRETAIRQSLVLSNVSLLEAIKSSDSTIMYLQETIKKYEKENKSLNSAIVVLSNTIAKYQDSLTSNITELVVIDSIVYPTYKREIDMFDNWIQGSVELGINKFNIELEVRNKYSIVTYTEKQGLFKSSIQHIEIVNENPFTSVIDIRNFQIEQPPPKTIRILGIGAVIGAITTIIIL